MLIRVIDIETTGVEPGKDQVIEIAALDITVDGVIVGQMNTLVSPGIPIPPQASAVHHIIDADVADAPPFAEVIEAFKGADVYVAHNASFERSFLEAHLGKSWICTYRCALRLWPDEEAHSNQYLRYRFGHVKPFGQPREGVQAHRAMGDVFVTAAIFHHNVRPAAAWERLVEWSGQPPLQTKFTFGKNRGKRYDSDPDYLRWMLRQADMDEDKKFSAQYWLDQLAKR